MAGPVDPDFLDLGVVEQRRQRPVARDPCERLAHRGSLVVDEFPPACEGEAIVPAHLGRGDLSSALRMPQRIGLLFAQAVANPLCDRLNDSRWSAGSTGTLERPCITGRGRGG